MCCTQRMPVLRSASPLRTSLPLSKVLRHVFRSTLKAAVVCGVLSGLCVWRMARAQGVRETRPLVSNADLGTDPECIHKDIWPPGRPKPGHPTIEEKREFIRVVSEDARQAEEEIGVPAAALVAMAIHESGFGFSRLALNANNVLGYKFPVRDVPPSVRRYSLKNCFVNPGESVDYAMFVSV
jgi:membrane-bound lytic murein transglycosylase B